MTARRLALFLLLSSLAVPAVLHTQSRKVRIACIGTDITFGSGIGSRDVNSYPSQLQALLGEGFEVRNYGKNGATVLKKGENPYTQEPEYREALEFHPDIVFIELGTNDSQPHNRVYLSGFERDYTDIVQSFLGLPSGCRVVLLLPPPVFTADSAGITASVLQDRIIPQIRAVAYSSGCEVIGLFNMFLDIPYCFPDQVNPSSIGAGMIAARVYEAVRMEHVADFDVVRNAGLTGSSSSYYGFVCLDFTFAGRNCKIVRPRKAAAGCPWIWRARFWGHEPQTEIALLERGFHVAYCDVAELFGNDEALSAWDRMFDLLVRGGLSNKVVLEGFSRGGVYLYAWAARHPHNVACVYADAPVLDLKSWPGGKGKSKGNPEEWERFKNDFGLKTEEQAVAFAGNPTDLAGRIAEAGFPMLHVCGDADEIVPIEENTDVFERRVLEKGGSITVIRKAGVGHHPHSLANPRPIVDFILNATGHHTRFASIPAPGNEYRQSAGWNSGMDWHRLFLETNRISDSISNADIVFLGNSITQGIGGRGRSIRRGSGDSVFTARFHNFVWLNFGISGDRTQQILWRVLHGNWEHLCPKVIVLTAGVNNFATDTGQDVAEGIDAIVRAILTKDDHVKVLLAGPLPAREKSSDYRKKFETVHSIISRLADNRRVFYSSMAFKMLRADRSLDPVLFAPDGIHLTPKGYERWADLLVGELAALGPGL
jgi:lysophospholipase L1-like esterase/pimeloyl-ACP methyl ester carboxylesterase